jgi:HEAT repeat protein
LINQEEIHRKSMSDNIKERIGAMKILRDNFAVLSDKRQAWDDLHRLTEDEDSLVRWEAAETLGVAFPLLPDKKQAWDDLLRLTEDEDSFVQGEAEESLRAAFPHIPDKTPIWNDLLRLTKDKDSDVRRRAARALESAFPHVPDKKQAWDGLLRLAKDKDSDVRRRAARALGATFPHVPDKTQSWNDLLRLTKDNDEGVRWRAVDSLGVTFPLVPDKKQAWNDLLRLTKEIDRYVRWRAVDSLGAAFPLVSDKKQAWDDLHRLTKEADRYVQRIAVNLLIATITHIPDKKQAWNSLIWLTKDKDSNVRRRAAELLGATFSQIPDKKQAWDDLILLTKDKDRDVRVFANHTLGRAYIFKATEANREEDFRKELEIALAFFEESSKEVTSYFNPARFCHLFYRSFYTLTFKQTPEAEVLKYLVAAKSAAEGSESKEKLLGAVENLAHALGEAQKVRELDLGTMKCDLNAYQRYCEQAVELVEQTKEKAPGATKMLERGLPIIDRRIKELLGEIEEKAKKFCMDSRQTPFETIGKSAYGSIKGLSEVEYLIEVEARMNRLSPLLRSMCNILPGESMKVICSQLYEIEEADPIHKLIIIESALSSINVQQNSMREQLAEQDRWIEYLKDLVLKRLDTINYSVFKLKLRSGEIVPTLRGIQTELNRLKTIQTDLKNFGLDLTELGNVQHHDLNSLNKEITRLAGEIETKVIPRLPEASDTQIVIEKLHDLKQSKGDVWFNRVAALSSIISLVLTIL